jgi:lipopolysaccharide transport system ATP-binding protein
MSTTASPIEYALDIVNLSKRFRRVTVKQSGYTTVKSGLLNIFRPAFWRRAKDTHTDRNYTTVLEDITLRIPKGLSVGVIGRNGTGKSTLLKLISGIYQPDAGHVEISGRIAALIELGAGFHPDFSGRENLLLGGIMHGLTEAEIASRFDTIVDFAELREVIDDPVRTYSSGMYMRLGFSLAVHTDPDLLIVDEVLAVGDAVFAHKCQEKIAELRRQKKTLLIVSHDLAAIERWCDEVLWLHKGKVRDRGHPRRVIDHYLSFIDKEEEKSLLDTSATISSTPDSSDTLSIRDELAPERWGSREIEITEVALRNDAGEDHRSFRPDEAVAIEIHYRVNEPVSDVVFGIGINRSDAVAILGTNTEIERVTLPKIANRGIVRYEIARLGLQEGTYLIDVAVHRKDGYPYDYHQRSIKFVVRWAEKQIGVILPAHAWKFSSGGAQ